MGWCLWEPSEHSENICAYEYLHKDTENVDLILPGVVR